MATIINTAALPKNLSASDLEAVYNGLDCCLTLEILHGIAPLLSNSTRSTYEFNKSMQGPVFEMSMRGLLVDREQRRRVLEEYRRDMSRLKQQLDRLLGEGLGVELSFNSPSQLKTLFYNILGLKRIRKRGANGFTDTVNREALEKLSTNYYAEPFCIRILKYRDLQKKVQFLETPIDRDGAFRSTFNIAGTKTGRLASSESEIGTGSNSQNVDRKLRSIFIPRPGYKFANFDLEQADARNVGALCWNIFAETRGEAFAGSFLDACESGDLHTTVCRMAWTQLNWPDDRSAWRAVADGIAYRDFTYRDLAKRLGHGSNFRGRPPTMAQNTKLPLAMVADFQRRYFDVFKCIPAWHGWIEQQLRDNGQLTTLFGDTRTFFGRADEDATLREAIAHCPQSMTAKEINFALLAAYSDNPFRKYYHLNVQVHDSILLEYKEETENELIPYLLKVMAHLQRLTLDRDFVVPVECKVGWNWGDVIKDKDGVVVGNEHGLTKWKGSDTRSPPEKLTIKDLF